MYNFSKIFITFFYLGYIKFAPGTFGTLVFIFIIYLLHILLAKIYFFILFFLILIFSIYFINVYQKKIKKNDPSEIIIDEFLGVFTIFLFFDTMNEINIYLSFFLIFILFRFFDILKPFPIGYIDKNIKNAFGVIFDDILAGVYTIIILKFINDFI